MARDKISEYKLRKIEVNAHRLCQCSLALDPDRITHYSGQENHGLASTRGAFGVLELVHHGCFRGAPWSTIDVPRMGKGTLVEADTECGPRSARRFC